MQKRITMLAGLLIAVPLAGAAAQTRSVAGCWLRPAPAPTCRDFILTEATAEIPLTRTAENEQRNRFTLGVGYMHNVSPESGVGGIVAWDVGRGWARPARGELRYRRWLTSTAVDFSAGVAQRGITGSDGTGREVRAYGPTTAVGVEWKYVALDLRGEFMRGDDRSFGGVYAGARATSAGAPIAALAGLALVFAVIATAGPT
jgi:hypothetical protein